MNTMLSINYLDPSPAMRAIRPDAFTLTRAASELRALHAEGASRPRVAHEDSGFSPALKQAETEQKLHVALGCLSHFVSSGLKTTD